MLFVEQQTINWPQNYNYRRSWYFHSNILDSLMAWLAGVQLNPVFLFPPSQAVSESTIFEWKYQLLRYVLQSFLRRINATCCCWLVVKSLGSNCLDYPQRNRRSQKSDISHAPYMTTMMILRVSIDDNFVGRNLQSKKLFDQFHILP